MNRISRVRYEVHDIAHMLIFFESGFIIDEGDDDFSILWNTGFFDEDEITVFYTFHVHRVSLSPQKEVLITRREEFGGYWDLGFDIFLGKYRHTASNSTDERYATYLVAITRILRRNAEFVLGVSVEPSFLDDLIKEYGYRPR